MKRVERRVVIAALPSEVFALLSDLDRIGEWQPGVQSVERTTPGPIGPGSTARLVRDVFGQRVEAPLTVTEYDAPVRLGIESTVSGVKARAILQLAPAEDGQATELDFAIEIRGSMMSTFLEPMIANAAASDIDASIARLQERLGRD